MRIVYLHQYFNTDEMAGSTRSAEMARRFAAAGHEVHIVTSRREAGGAPGWQVSHLDGYQVHWCTVPYSNRMGVTARLRAFADFALRSCQRSASLDGDVIFATSTPLTIAIPGAYAAWRARAPMVLEIRDLWPELPIAIGALRGGFLIWLARALERWAYRRSTRIVALSPGMRDGAIAAGAEPTAITVVPNAADLTRFAAAGEEVARVVAGQPWINGRPIVLYAGTLGRMNGVGYLARLARAMLDRGSDACFIVIGDGAELDAIQAEAVQLGVWQRNFYRLPPVPKREVAAWFAAATVVSSLFIDLPEMRANSANKFFDGLAAGKPVMINYAGWHADLIAAHRCGILLPPSDPALAAERLMTALNDPGALAAMGKASQALAEAQFDRDRLAGQVLAVLTEVARA